MGAWGTGIFENDTAGDWSVDLADHEDLAFIEGALRKVLDSGDGHIDGDVASEALAACEVLARLLGESGTSDADTESIDAWVAAHASLPAQQLVSPALAVVDRVVRAPSELIELWDESDEGPAFRAVIAGLRERLARHGTPLSQRRPWWKLW